MGRAKKKTTKTQSSSQKVKQPPLSEAAQLAIERYRTIREICAIAKWPIMVVCLVIVMYIWKNCSEDEREFISLLFKGGAIIVTIISIILGIAGSFVLFITKKVQANSDEDV